jgi:hypothetical protein
MYVYLLTSCLRVLQVIQLFENSYLFKLCDKLAFRIRQQMNYESLFE